VILYSDLPDKEEMVRKAGADAFLAKPFGVSELFSLVQRFVVDGQSGNA
jgi:CheY-like chemotaxis protein